MKVYSKIGSYSSKKHLGIYSVYENLEDIEHLTTANEIIKNYFTDGVFDL